MTVPEALWRPMRGEDLPAVVRLADLIHPGLPEDEAIFAERLRLYPEGSRVLAAAGGLVGYAVAHPIRYPEPPSLNTLLGALPARSDALYVHDVAIAPEARGRGHAEAVVAALLDLAAGFPRACLVSVYGTPPFWRRFGFLDASRDVSAARLAAYGPDARFMVRLTPV